MTYEVDRYERKTALICEEQAISFSRMIYSLEMR